MDVDRELDDMSRVQLYAVIKDLRTELNGYKTMANSYQKKYFNLFTQINEIIVSKKSEVLDVMSKDIQCFDDLKQKRNLSENDSNETNTESNEQNTNKSQERVESIENANNSHINVMDRHSDEENQIITESYIIDDTRNVTTEIVPVKFESISDVQEFNQIHSSDDSQNDENSVPKTPGFGYSSNSPISINSEETPNQTIVKNESKSEDKTEEVCNNEFQITIGNIRSLRSESIDDKSEDNNCSDETLIEHIIQSKAINQQKTDSSKQMFECNECLKVFGNDYELKRHKMIHTNEKPFKCDECYKQFRQSSQLKDHQLIHTNERQFVCDWNECGKRFFLKQYLKEHKRRVHLTEKQFECDYKDCKKTYRDKHDLNRHKRIHSGEKPFICDHKNCDKRFTYKFNLNRHKQNVHLQQQTAKSSKPLLHIK